MNVYVFKGKNWKLASPKKWIKEIAFLDDLKEKVGSIKLEDTEFEVYPIEDGFAAIESTKETTKEKHRWVVNAAGGNINTYMGPLSENEAKNTLEQICDHWKTVGVLYRYKEDGTTERIYSYSAKTTSSKNHTDSMKKK